MLKWLLPLIMLPLCLHAQPQPFSAEISLSATQISIEENLAVELLLSYPDTHIVDLEKWELWLAGLTRLEYDHHLPARKGGALGSILQAAPDVFDAIKKWATSKSPDSKGSDATSGESEKD